MSTAKLPNPSRVLTLLNIGHLLLLVLTATVGIPAGLSDPIDLVVDPANEDSFDELPHFPTLMLVAALLFASSASVFAGSVLLLMFKPIGAWIHLVGNVSLLALIPLAYAALGIEEFSAPTLAAYVTEGATWITAGCLYGVAFFTSALHSPPGTECVDSASTQPPM